MRETFLKRISLIALATLSAACSGAQLASNRLPSSEPSPAPSSVPSPVLDYKEPVWNVFEGQSSRVTAFKAEKGIQSSTVTKITPQNDAKTIQLKEKEEQALREKVSHLSILIPKKPGARSKEDCAHWIEIESLYGKRFYCEGYESDGAFELIQTLHEMMAK